MYKTLAKIPVVRIILIISIFKGYTIIIYLFVPEIGCPLIACIAAIPTPATDATIPATAINITLIFKC
jgi:hypothetical protein